MRKRTPLYLDSLEAAQKKGREEVDKYLASYKANVRCAEDIKRTIYYYYDGFRLPDGFEDRVLDTYGLERMSYVWLITFNICLTMEGLAKKIRSGQHRLRQPKMEKHSDQNIWLMPM